MSTTNNEKKVHYLQNLTLFSYSHTDPMTILIEKSLILTFTNANRAGI